MCVCVHISCVCVCACVCRVCGMCVCVCICRVYGMCLCVHISCVCVYACICRVYVYMRAYAGVRYVYMRAYVVCVVCVYACACRAYVFMRAFIVGMCTCVRMQVYTICVAGTDRSQKPENAALRSSETCVVVEVPKCKYCVQVPPLPLCMHNASAGVWAFIICGD